MCANFATATNTIFTEERKKNLIIEAYKCRFLSVKAAVCSKEYSKWSKMQAALCKPHEKGTFLSFGATGVEQTSRKIIGTGSASKAERFVSVPILRMASPSLLDLLSYFVPP